MQIGSRARRCVSFPPPLYSIGFWPSSGSSRGVSNRFDRCRLFPHLISSLFIGLTVRDTICALRYYLYDHCWHQAKLTNFFKQFEMSRAARHDKWDDPRDVFVEWHRNSHSSGHGTGIILIGNSCGLKINRIKLRGKRVRLFIWKWEFNKKPTYQLPPISTFGLDKYQNDDDIALLEA